jgi:hypothetical protein
MEHREGARLECLSAARTGVALACLSERPSIYLLDYVSLKVQPFLTKLGYLTNRSGKLF